MQKKRDKKKQVKKQTTVRDLKPSKEVKGGSPYPNPIFIKGVGGGQ